MKKEILNIYKYGLILVMKSLWRALVFIFLLKVIIGINYTSMLMKDLLKNIKTE